MEKTWNVLDILTWTTSFVEKKNIEDAKYKTELLLAHVLELDRFQLYLNFDRPMSKKERDTFKALLNRLVEHEPIQYILGTWDFYGYAFKVTPDVLIPRRETEELVEKVIQYVKQKTEEMDFLERQKPLHIADIGTGSGAIILALYQELKKELSEDAFKQIQFTAGDFSEKALEIARENASLYDAGVDFFHSNLLEKIENHIDILISNPPYVSLQEYQELKKELFFEPKTAITDEGNGLFFYESLLKSMKTKEIPKAFFEIGYNQREALEILCKDLNFSSFSIHKDLSQNDRILEVDL